MWKSELLSGTWRQHPAAGWSWSCAARTHALSLFIPREAFRWSNSEVSAHHIQHLRDRVLLFQLRRNKEAQRVNWTCAGWVFRSFLLKWADVGMRFLMRCCRLEGNEFCWIRMESLTRWLDLSMICVARRLSWCQMEGSEGCWSKLKRCHWGVLEEFRSSSEDSRRSLRRSLRRSQSI